MTDEQLSKAIEIVKRNLEAEDDWVVLKNSMDTLGKWVMKDDQLKAWLLPHLDRLSQNPRKVVARTAEKVRAKLQ